MHHRRVLGFAALLIGLLLAASACTAVPSADQTQASLSTYSVAPTTALALSGVTGIVSAADAPGRAAAGVLSSCLTISPLTTPVYRPVAVFLGDSYTSGWNGIGSGSRGWASDVAAALGARKINLAVAGTGFVRGGTQGGTEGQRVGRQLPAAIAAKPAIVFLAAGLNDIYSPRARVLQAADDVVFRLRSALPKVRIVIIGPWWPKADLPPPATLIALRDRLRADATRIGAVFVDPYGDRWFAGVNRQFIGPDHWHPTDAGYRFIARKVLSAISAWVPEPNDPRPNRSGSAYCVGGTSLPR